MNASFAASAWLVARAEWRAMQRNRVGIVAAALLLALTLAALLVSHEQLRTVRHERAQFQLSADHDWKEQPDRHPHRVVHYGHFVFKPLSPLAFFDFGVEPFTGHALYLEGHRQNSANFSDAGQSSLLLRFGQLTPAFVLQVITPLLIVFLAFGSIAREREGGQLRLLLAHGLRGGALLAGKLLSHAAVALLLALPAFAALLALAALHPEVRGQALWMILGYALYLLSWAGGAVLVSATVRRARDALVALAGAWIVIVILVPRLMPDLAAASIDRPTRIESEAAIHERLKALGDSHDPDDPHFARFRQQTLAKYGVARIEDLPVNYGGLVIAEGERLTSELFVQFMQEDFARQDAQRKLVDGAAFASPLLALRRLSMALAGTDLDGHMRFLLAGEQYRYEFVQALNRLHATEVAYENDRDQRISRSHWQDMAPFALAAPPLETTLASHVQAALATFAGWLGLLALGAAFIAHKLERNAQ